MEPKWNQSGTTQVERFGVGLFWRNLILESPIITGGYEQKGHLDGRGERI